MIRGKTFLGRTVLQSNLGLPEFILKISKSDPLLTQVQFEIHRTINLWEVIHIYVHAEHCEMNLINTISAIFIRLIVYLMRNEHRWKWRFRLRQ